MKTIKTFILSLMAATALLAPALVPVSVNAQSANIKQGLCNGANLSADPNAPCDSTAPDTTGRVNDIIRLVIDLFSLVVGVVAVVMIIFGGLKYITSGGESSNISSAKSTIMYAIIGLIFVALSQFIVRFVLSKASI